MADRRHPDQGRLFYLMGPSGAGKDSLLDACRGEAVAGHTLRIAPRHITRGAHSGGEDHIALTPEAFNQQVAARRFALYWRANGRGYGIGKEIDDWLRAGEAVLVNGSRGHLDEARARYGHRLVPVLVCVDPRQQRQRLLARGRESAAEIEARIERSLRLQAELENRFATIHNNGSLAHAVSELLATVRAYLPDRANMEKATMDDNPP